MPVVTFLHNHILACFVTLSKWTCAFFKLLLIDNLWEKEYNFSVFCCLQCLFQLETAVNCM